MHATNRTSFEHAHKILIFCFEMALFGNLKLELANLCQFVDVKRHFVNVFIKRQKLFSRFSSEKPDHIIFVP